MFFFSDAVSRARLVHELVRETCTRGTGDRDVRYCDFRVRHLVAGLRETRHVMFSTDRGRRHGVAFVWKTEHTVVVCVLHRTFMSVVVVRTRLCENRVVGIQSLVLAKRKHDPWLKDIAIFRYTSSFNMILFCERCVCSVFARWLFANLRIARREVEMLILCELIEPVWTDFLKYNSFEPNSKIRLG